MKRIEMISKNMSHDKAIKILAKSMYRELINNGFSIKEIIDFSRELIENIEVGQKDIDFKNVASK